MPTQTYTTTGSDTFTVPASVELLKCTLTGAEGGGGVLGGQVVAYLPVTPGEDLQVNVGTGGASTTDGGGYSDVRQGGTALTDQVLVAGGAGGDGSSSGVDNSDDEGAGGSAGEDGGDASSGTSGGSPLAVANGGAGATQSAGGGGGSASAGSDADNGASGSRGSGGAGGASINFATGGDGGDGYYGGGGGGAAEFNGTYSWVAAGGGGGGSNYFGAAVTPVSNSAAVDASNGGDGKVVLEYLATPGSFSVTQDGTNPDTELDASWSDVTGETGYEVQRSTDGGSSWSAFSTPAADATSFADTSLTQGKRYDYRLRATASGLYSAWTEDFATTDLPDPSGFEVTASATLPSTAVSASWTINSTDETGFDFEYSRGASGTETAAPFTQPSSESDWEAGGSVNAGVTAAGIPNLLNGEEMVFRMRATGEDANSDWVEATVV